MGRLHWTWYCYDVSSLFLPLRWGREGEGTQDKSARHRESGTEWRDPGTVQRVRLQPSCGVTCTQPWTSRLFIISCIACMAIQACHTSYGWLITIIVSFQSRNVYLLMYAVLDDYCYVYRLSAGLLRQATYSTTRLGVYQSLFDMFTG